MSREIQNRISDNGLKIVGPAAEQLLSHLGDELKSIEAMLKAVREVHFALLVLDDDALSKSLEVEARELSASLAIQKRRRYLQSELATILQMAPGDVTLRRLIGMTSGSLRDSIDQMWRSLSEMAAEVDRINRQNAAMINQSLAIARGVIERLTGVTAVNESYNAVGGRAETHVGPLIQWGG